MHYSKITCFPSYLLVASYTTSQSRDFFKWLCSVIIETPSIFLMCPALGIHRNQKCPGLKQDPQNLQAKELNLEGKVTSSVFSPEFSAFAPALERRVGAVEGD